MILTPLELPDLVDWSHPLSDDPLNAGLVAAYMAVPNAMGWGSLTVRDLCGRNHGTLNGGVQWSGDSHKGGFGAMRFNGSNAYVSSLLNSSIDAFPFLISAWMKTSDSTSATRTIIGIGHSVFNSRHIAINLTSAHRAEYTLIATDGTNVSITGSDEINDGEWHHVVGVSAGGSSHVLYVDGVEVGSSNNTAVNLGLVKASAGALWRTSVTQFFPGLLNAALIFNRALTAPEIATRYERERNYFEGLLNRYDSDWATVGGFSPAWALHRTQLIGGGVL